MDEVSSYSHNSSAADDLTGKYNSSKEMKVINEVDELLKNINKKNYGFQLPIMKE